VTALRASGAGAYIAKANIYSADLNRLYDSSAVAINVSGELRFDVKVDCWRKVVRSGEFLDVNLFVLNLGDFYRDVNLIWNVNDDANNVLDSGEMAIAVKPGQSQINGYFVSMRR